MPKLRPRARIIRTIGDQLISGPEAALIELVKNSFDADSPYVSIQIIPADKPDPEAESESLFSGIIRISDAGHGMSEGVILGSWFEPATDEKLIRRVSPEGRQMLGAKGIGRFAAARLGRYTDLESVYLKGGTAFIATVHIDWDWFTANKYLDEVEIGLDVKPLKPAARRHPGVSLKISDLRDEWNQKALEDLIRELRRVASPARTRESHFAIRLDITAFNQEAHGFNGQDLLNKSNLPSNFGETEQAIDPFLIRPFALEEHADYVLDGAFDKAGEFKGTFTIHRGDATPQSVNVAAPVLESGETSCGPFTLHINIYDRENDAIEGLFSRMGLDLKKVGLLNARRILTENAGISIFRKNFRIRPYGEPENDWLELERQRVQDPSKKLGISQVAGFVTVADEEKSQLVERSSREGLEHNGSFQRLKRLIQNVLLHAEARRFDFREKAGLSRKLPGNLENLRQAASLRRVARVAKTLPKPYRIKVEEAINQDSAELAEELKEIDNYQQILQSRAALGLVLAEVIHEGRRILNPIASSAKAIIEGKGWLLDSTEKGEVYRQQFPDNAQTVHDGVRDLSRLFKKLDPVSGRRRGRPGKIRICDVVQRSVDLFEESCTYASIRVNFECPNDLIGFGYEDDLQAASMNIIDNGIYWLSTAQEPRTLEIKVKKRQANAVIILSNNGPTIAESYHERLFDAGFTLKSAGTGLGLAIAREAMRRSKGDVQFNADADITTFMITLPLLESN